MLQEGVDLGAPTTDKITLTPDERAYYELIDRCAVRGTNKKISNARPQHARYLIDKLFSLSAKSVRVYSGELAPDAYDELLGERIEIFAHRGVIDAAVEATGRGVDVKVVVEKPGVDLTNHPLIEAIRKDGVPSKFRFGWIGQAGLDLLNKNSVNRHMVVMDKSAYRLEFDGHPDVSAEANFGDPSFAATLARTFDLATARSELATP